MKLNSNFFEYRRTTFVKTSLVMKRFKYVVSAVVYPSFNKGNKEIFELHTHLLISAAFVSLLPLNDTRECLFIHLLALLLFLQYSLTLVKSSSFSYPVWPVVF